MSPYCGGLGSIGHPAGYGTRRRPLPLRHNDQFLYSSQDQFTHQRCVPELLRKKIAMKSPSFFIFAFFLPGGHPCPGLPIPSYTSQNLANALKPPPISHPFWDRTGSAGIVSAAACGRPQATVIIASFATGALLPSIGLGFTDRLCWLG